MLDSLKVQSKLDKSKLKGEQIYFKLSIFCDNKFSRYCVHKKYFFELSSFLKIYVKLNVLNNSFSEKLTEMGIIMEKNIIKYISNKLYY